MKAAGRISLFVVVTIGTSAASIACKKSENQTKDGLANGKNEERQKRV